LQTVKQASDLQDSVSKILHLDNKLEQDEMEGVEEEEWVRFQKHDIQLLLAIRRLFIRSFLFRGPDFNFFFE